MLAFVSFAPTLDPFGHSTEMRCVLHACVSYVFIGTLARRKKTILSKLAIIIRVQKVARFRQINAENPLCAS